MMESDAGLNMCVRCGKALNSTNGKRATNTWIKIGKYMPWCTKCQQKKFLELSAISGNSLALFYCCIVFDTPFDMLAIPRDTPDKIWIEYLKNLHQKGLDEENGEILGFTDGLTDITKIFGASLSEGEFSKAVSNERSARGRQPGTKAQREIWGVGNPDKPYTTDEYNELDRIYEALSADLASLGTISAKQELILRSCTKWTKQMNDMSASGQFDKARKLSAIIQENLASEQLRKKDAKPIDDTRIDTLTDVLEKAGLLKDGKQCSPDKMFEILFGRPPKYPYTKDAADQIILINENRMRNNEGRPELPFLPDDMRLSDELSEFAEFQNPQEKQAYKDLGLVKMPPKKNENDQK